ncbi:hypothetical protein SNOG_06528 [Parastagonospora nodorum SN15]|uniref:Uncharacterized protein n=1 Tax=Phaeosphaeria nodorum (strain SN15 / ATCC MYA-4574 / FGSC 10173) TaxID=321614 RepID=Q0UNY6_PHANO|nr:hypothetical protein SNOG_06528 [Parastagonospora nodorum SN15]EAT86359.1 hypothetical protein SNOG_06528 [Parastagonospora nodorum SN15]
MVRRNRAMEDADKRPESCAGDEITASALSSVTPGEAPTTLVPLDGNE